MVDAALLLAGVFWPLERVLLSSMAAVGDAVHVGVGCDLTQEGLTPA